MKRMYMRRKRAAARGDGVVNQTLARLKPGRKPKPKPAKVEEEDEDRVDGMEDEVGMEVDSKGAQEEQGTGEGQDVNENGAEVPKESMAADDAIEEGDVEAEKKTRHRHPSGRP